MVKTEYFVEMTEEDWMAAAYQLAHNRCVYLCTELGTRYDYYDHCGNCAVARAVKRNTNHKNISVDYEELTIGTLKYLHDAENEVRGFDNYMDRAKYTRPDFPVAISIWRG